MMRPFFFSTVPEFAYGGMERRGDGSNGQMGLPSVCLSEASAPAPDFPILNPGSAASRRRKIDLRFLRVRPIKKRRVSNRPHDLHLLEGRGNRFRGRSFVLGGRIEHPDGDQLPGVEGFFDGLYHRLCDPFLADVNEGILAVCERPKMGPLSTGESF